MIVSIAKDGAIEARSTHLFVIGAEPTAALRGGALGPWSLLVARHPRHQFPFSRHPQHNHHHHQSPQFKTKQSHHHRSRSFISKLLSNSYVVDVCSRRTSSHLKV